MPNLKRNDTNEFIYKTERDSDLENDHRRRMGEGRVREFGIDMYTPLYLKWITSKDLLYRAGNSAQCYVAAWMGGEPGGEWIHGYSCKGSKG